METSRTKILIVDDHPILRDGLARMLESSGRFQLCGEASSWPEAVECFAASKPDLVILDISLGKRIGLDLIQEFKVFNPRVRILVLSMHDEMAYAERALRSGAHGYVMKSDAVQIVLGALDKIIGGGIYLSDRVAAMLLQKSLHADAIEAAAGVQILTNREFEIFSLIGTGLSSEGIATRLSLSLKTVEAHRANIRMKLGIESGQRLIETAISYARSNA